MRKDRRTTVVCSFSKSGGAMMMLAMPVSSSRLRNTNPLAVPGRWRAMTAPATDTNVPSGNDANFELGTTPWRSRREGGFGGGWGPRGRGVPRKIVGIPAPPFVGFGGDAKEGRLGFRAFSSVL